MNCHDMTAILNDRDPTSLMQIERSSLAEHISTCRSCRDEWRAHVEAQALSVAPTPRHLLAAVSRAIDRETVKRTAASKRSRSYIVVGVALAGAVAAAASRWLSIEPGLEKPSPVAPGDYGRTAPPTSIAPPVEPGLSSATLEPTVVAPAGNSDSRWYPPLPGDALATSTLDRNTIVVLPAEGVSEVPDAAEEVEELYAELLAGLKSIGMNVIGPDSVRFYDEIDDAEIGRAFGAATVLVTRLERQPETSEPFIESHLFATHSRQLVYGVGVAGDPGAFMAEPLVRQIGDVVRPRSLEQMIQDAEIRLRDRTLSDSERLAPFLNPWLAASRDRLMAAAVALASEADESATRASVWSSMRGVGDPYLVPFLLDAFRNDPSEAVKRQAELTLRQDFADYPEVDAALSGG